MPPFETDCHRRIAALRDALSVEHCTVAVFFKDGESVVFENVRAESIEFFAPENMLTMVLSGGREVNVPGVRYWTEDAR